MTGTTGSSGLAPAEHAHLRRKPANQRELDEEHDERDGGELDAFTAHSNRFVVAQFPLHTGLRFATNAFSPPVVSLISN